MKRIFISYRRSDSSTITGRIYDRLVLAFGEERVFKDVDDIPLGQDFRKTLEDEVSKCDVLLVIIGKQWANVVDSDGNRRLNDPNDFVSIEVAVGLMRPNVLVVPCLVNGATLPTPEELPPDLQDLRFRNAATVRDDPDFKHDMVRLIEHLKKAEAYRHGSTNKGNYRSAASASARLAFIVLGITVLLIAITLGAILPRLSSSVTSTVTATSTVTETPLATVISEPSATFIPEPMPTPTIVERMATTKDGARVWAHPAAVRGDKFFTLPVGITVILIGDPVKGPIIFDSDAQGDWYHVRSTDGTFEPGWIWSERVIIQPD
ncbi:MAG: TIR domain-containing protein [Anaerolineaceae bacterium]|nr:TIR domain-containing protein [Anaerolineaceae bacterium]